MIKTTYQTPELRDSNDNIVQEGAFGKNTALSNSDNTGWIDYVVNNLEALHDTIGDSAAHLDGNGHVVEPANLAIGDEDGNRLKTSYLKLTGGTVAGTLNVQQNLKFQDNQENVFGGVYIPSSSATEQYAQFYGGEGTGVAGAKLTLYPDGDGRFKLDARSTDGSNTYTLVTDNSGNLNWRGYPLAWKKDYLPLAGGTMTGPIYYNNTGGMIRQVSDDQRILICGGSDWYNGADLILYGKDNNAGSFQLVAKTDTADVRLVGETNGSLKWGGNSIALSKDVLPLSGGTLTGNVKSSVTDWRIGKSNENGATSLYGGTSWSTGPSLALYGAGNSNSPGCFDLSAHNGTTRKQLIGKPDGTLTWDSNAIWTSKTEAAKTPMLDVDNVLSTSNITYQQVGKLVYVNISALRMSSTATATYNGMSVASGFPTPAFTQKFGALQTSDESAQPMPSINTNGTMYVGTRGTSIANKVLTGGFVYIAQ